jgi:hypothetical protein
VELDVLGRKEECRVKVMAGYEVDVIVRLFNHVASRAQSRIRVPILKFQLHTTWTLIYIGSQSNASQETCT